MNISKQFLNLHSSLCYKTSRTSISVWYLLSTVLKPFPNSFICFSQTQNYSSHRDESFPLHDASEPRQSFQIAFETLFKMTAIITRRYILKFMLLLVLSTFEDDMLGFSMWDSPSGKAFELQKQRANEFQAKLFVSFVREIRKIIWIM